MTTDVHVSPHDEQQVEAERTRLLGMLQRGYDSLLVGRIVDQDEMRRRIDQLLAENKTGEKGGSD